MTDWLIDDHLYSAILRSLEQTHCARLWFYMSGKLFIVRFLNIHRSGVLTALAWLVPHETAAISACHFMQSYIRKVYACLAVTCHLRFWQNDRGLLRATAVTRGWNGYRNKSQHRKLTLEKKILPPLLQRIEPTTFRSLVQRSNHWAIPSPLVLYTQSVWLIQGNQRAWKTTEQSEETTIKSLQGSGSVRK